MLGQEAKTWLVRVLEERFGLSFALQEKNQSYQLFLQDEAQPLLIFDRLDPLFYVKGKSSLHCHQYDVSTQHYQGAIHDCLPMPSSVDKPSILVTQQGNTAIVHYDILGLVYWALNRLEELGAKEQDQHERYPSTASHAHRYHYLQRPIVDEWLAVLGQMIQQVRPQISLKKHHFSIFPTHDVDRPSKFAYWPFKNVLKNMAKDLIYQKKISTLWQAPLIFLGSSKTLRSQDSFNTFSWLMDQSEAAGVKSAFYFITGKTSALDAFYTLEDGAIQYLLQTIHQRGHEIGLHPSYHTFNNEKALAQEFLQLKKTAQTLGIQQEKWGGRMHYLRWQQEKTLSLWDKAGLDYDSTLSYADQAGFRCGTCYEYPAFDVLEQKMLHLRIRPLIMMEASIFYYQGLGLTDKAYEAMADLKTLCQKVNGRFTFLWHNNELDSPLAKQMYATLLKTP